MYTSIQQIKVCSKQHTSNDLHFTKWILKILSISILARTFFFLGADTLGDAINELENFLGYRNNKSIKNC